MKTKQQLYRVKVDNSIVRAEQQIDGYLGNWLNDGKICEYTRGEAIKKARAFGGKIEKVSVKAIAKRSFKLWLCIEEHVEFIDGTDEFHDVDPEDLDNIASIGTFETIEAAREFMKNLNSTYSGD